MRASNNQSGKAFGNEERKKEKVEGDCSFEEPLLIGLVDEPGPKLWSGSVKVWREMLPVKLPDSARSSSWLVVVKG